MYCLCRTVWQQSPLILTTLAIVMMVTTLQLLYLTLTVRGLFVLNCSFHVLCGSVCPLTARVDRYNNSPDDIPLDLVFFSAFEDLRLRITGTMESNGIRKLYEPSPVPTLYVGKVEDILGRVPLFPCFLDGNTTSWSGVCNSFHCLLECLTEQHPKQDIFLTYFTPNPSYVRHIPPKNLHHFNFAMNADFFSKLQYNNVHQLCKGYML